MSTNSNFDRIAEAWLAEGPTQLADRVLDVALDEVHVTRQRRRLPAPWRSDLMLSPLRLAAAAVIGALLVGAIYFNLPRRNEVGGSSPTPTWKTFTSERFGYSVMLPGNFVPQTTPDGLPSALFPGDQNEWADRFDAPVAHVPFLVIARATPQHPMTLLDVTIAYDESLADGCDVTPLESVTVSGVAARLVSVSCLPYSWFDVTIEHDGHLYVLQWNAARASLDADRLTFDQVLNSFAFLN